MNLPTPLARLPRAKRFLPKLKKLGLKTVRDLLRHFPNRYEDFSQVTRIADLKQGTPATILGIVKNISTRRSWKNRKMTISEASVEDNTGPVKVVWFNQPYLTQTLRKGKEIYVSGIPEYKDNELVFTSPIYETADGSQIHTARIIPIYPETKGITSRGIRYLIKPIIDSLPKLKDPIPADIRENAKIPELNEAIKEIHFPKSLDAAKQARQRFIFEDLFLFQLYNLLRRRKFSEKPSRSIQYDAAYIDSLAENLPFPLTQSQKEALRQICSDISRKHPMRRLLQGDVGSGKTIVAALAALNAARQGIQTAFMAPTEILARQHFETIAKHFPNFKEEIAIVTSSTKTPEILARVAAGEAKIVIGTHALIQKHVTFGKLGLVIVDEQHRFGVEQRARLLKNTSGKDLTPHFLSMTATPIPRSLALTVFSDLDVSYLTEMPKGRKEIETYIVPPEKRKDSHNFIRKQIREGRQAFVICPRIELNQESGARDQESEIKSVKIEYQKLSREIFPDMRVGMLHGKLKPREKNSIMRSFADRKIDILVSTSVVEVGVDVPNAAIMVIEGAERFGLAQLYQLRGRIGRGEYKSYCLLFTESRNKSVYKRLESVAKAKNGLELAEHDLKLRGPGEFFGTTQKGKADIAMMGVQNQNIAKRARVYAAELLKKDPALRLHPALKLKLQEIIKNLHKE